MLPNLELVSSVVSNIDWEVVSYGKIKTFLYAQVNGNASRSCIEDVAFVSTSTDFPPSRYLFLRNDGLLMNDWAKRGGRLSYNATLFISSPPNKTFSPDCLSRSGPEIAALAADVWISLFFSLQF